MDDTIEDLLGAWVQWLNKEHGTTVQPSDITSWVITDFFPTLTQEQVFAPLIRKDFWQTVRPLEGAAEALQKLIADGHRVLIVTSSAYQTIPVKMNTVLFKEFPFLSWDDVIITQHKQLIQGDVLVDDAVHNLEGGEYAKILMTAPHNQVYDAEGNGMIRANNWQEAYSAIKEVAETST